MPDPEEVTKGLTGVITKGLGILGQGVGVVSQVLRSADASVQQVDGALTGVNPAPPAAAPLGGQAASEEQVAQQVASLVREAGGEATATGNPQAPGAVGKFQEALSRLFRLQIPTTESLADLVPTPMEMLRGGLKDLRGNMALVRLANGMGTLGDVQEVANYAEVVTGRIQGLHTLAPIGAAPPVEAAAPPVEAPPPGPTPRKRRGKPQRKKKRSKGVVFAEAVAAEVDNPQVTAWQEEYAFGDIDEQEWVSRLATWAEAQGYDSLDPIFDKAAARAKK